MRRRGSEAAALNADEVHEFPRVCGSFNSEMKLLMEKDERITTTTTTTTNHDTTQRENKRVSPVQHR